MNLLKLYKVEFDKNHEDVIGFKTKAEQADYFKTRESASFLWEDLTIVKDSDISNIRIKGNYNILQTVNYAYFENEIDGVICSYYAFVDRVSYVSYDTVSLSLSIDVWQTYLFSHVLEPSFIERGHVRRWNQDGTADLTYCRTPESVQVGSEYANNYEKCLVCDTTEGNNTWDMNLDTWESVQGTDLTYKLLYYVVLLAYDEDSKAPIAGVPKATKYPIAQPFTMLILPFFAEKSNSSSPVPLKLILSGAQDGGYAVDFVSFQSFIAKQPLTVGAYLLGDFPVKGDYTISGGGAEGTLYTRFMDSIRISFNYDPQDPSKLVTGYIFTPNADTLNAFVNSIPTPYKSAPMQYDLKCYMSPYTEYYISQQRGNELVIKPQYLANDCYNKEDKTVSFTCRRQVSLTDQIKTIYYCDETIDTATGYVNTATAVQSNNNMPLITDAYLNYLYTRQASAEAGLFNTYVSGALGLAGAAVTRNIFGGISSAFSTGAGIAQYYAQIEDLQRTPDNLKQPGNNVILEAENHTIQTTLYRRQIADSELKRLNRYFTLYGYTVKDYLNFDLNSRKYFNYVQTVDCRVTGDINEEHIEALQTRYNNGIRIWHYDPNDWHGIGDYTLDNEEVYING